MFDLEVDSDILTFFRSYFDQKRCLIFNSVSETFSGHFLNFQSKYAFLHKKIISLIDRLIFLSHSKFHKDNFDLIINILLDNGYPLNLIFHAIKRLHSRFYHHSLYNVEQPMNAKNITISSYNPICFLHSK